MNVLEAHAQDKSKNKGKLKKIISMFPSTLMKLHLFFCIIPSYFYALNPTLKKLLNSFLEQTFWFRVHLMSHCYYDLFMCTKIFSWQLFFQGTKKTKTAWIQATTVWWVVQQLKTKILNTKKLFCWPYEIERCP